MKILDGLKLKGKTVKIPNTRKNDLPEFFVEMGYKVGAEIGVYTADFTKQLCRARLTVYGVDPWAVYPDFDRMNEARKKRQEDIYDRAVRRLARFKTITLIRKMSMDAIHDFKNGSLDFVYIDGNHRFRFVAEDIYEWERKVRKGGIVAGHDYGANVGGVEPSIYQVRPVVDAYVKAFGIKKLYIVGDLDSASSWFWIKE